MFFILSKSISFLTSPSFWIFLLLILSIVFINKRIGKKLLISSILALVFFTNSAIFNTIAKQWEQPYLQQPFPKTHYTYGIVLGGMAEYDTIIQRTKFAQSADRLFQALILLKQNTIDTLVISGGSAKILEKERYEAAFLKEYCIKIGFNGNKILVDSLSRNTAENAKFASRIINKSENTILLITSSYHLPRALGCFKKQGINATGFGTDALTESHSLGPEAYIIPSIGMLSCWDRLIHEWIGYVTYKIKGEV